MFLDDDRIESAASDHGATPPADAPVIGWDTGVQWEIVDPASAMPPPARVTLSIGSVLGRTLELFLRRPLVFIAFALPGTLVSLLLPGSDSGQTINGLFWPIFFASLVVAIVSILATVIAADDVRANGSVGIVSVVRRALDRTPVAIGSSIVQYLALIGVWVVAALILSGLLTSGSAPLAVLLLILVGIGILHVFVRWSLANAAIALERVGPIASLRRSRALTAGNVRRIWGIYLLLAVLILPLDVAVYLLGFASTDESLQTFLSAVGGLAAGPLLPIASAVILGDLTGRQETAPSRPTMSRLGLLFSAGMIGLGVAGIAIAFPKVGPAWERQGWAVPDADRGRLIAGTGHDPAHPCTPVGVSTTFSSADTIYLGGYFRFGILPGERSTLEIYVDDALTSSTTLPVAPRAQACFEGDPIGALRPGSYHVVVRQEGLQIGEGFFAVR
jgi:hypothetical protein